MSDEKQEDLKVYASRVAAERDQLRAELAMRVADLDALTARMCEATTELAAAKAERDHEIKRLRLYMTDEEYGAHERHEHELAEARAERDDWKNQLTALRASHAKEVASLDAKIREQKDELINLHERRRHHAAEIEAAREDAYRGGFNADHKYDCPYNYRIWKATKETTYEHISKNVLIEVDPTDVGAQLEKLEQKLLRVVGRTVWPIYAGSFSEMVCQLLWDTIAAAEERALRWADSHYVDKYGDIKELNAEQRFMEKYFDRFLAAYRAKPAPEGEKKLVERRKRQRRVHWQCCFDVGLPDERRIIKARRRAPFTYKGEGEHKLSARDQIFADIVAERERQDAKWGGPWHDDQHSFVDWAKYIEERIPLLWGVNDVCVKAMTEIAALTVAALESEKRIKAQEVQG